VGLKLGEVKTSHPNLKEVSTFKTLSQYLCKLNLSEVHTPAKLTVYLPSSRTGEIRDTSEILGSPILRKRRVGAFSFLSTEKWSEFYSMPIHQETADQ
jgi:hypothetical protein